MLHSSRCRVSTVIAAFLLVSVSLPAGALPPPRSYRVIPLGQLGTRNYSVSLNNHGDVVGTYFTTEYNSEYHGFLYHDGQMIDLFPGEFTYVMGINDAGTIAGLGTPTLPEYGWTYTPGGQRKLIAPLSGSASYPSGINQQGTVVGYSGNPFHPYTYDAAGIHDMGLPPGARYASGSDVNASGDIVGVAFNGAANHAVLRSGGAWRYLSENYMEGWALSINDSGVAVGYVRTESTDTRAFRYVNATLKLVAGPFTNSWGNDVNSAGLMVGAYHVDTATPSGFIDDGTETMDLNVLVQQDSGWNIRWASAINDLGQIAGWGSTPQGEQRALLLVPLPDPAGGVVMAFGIVVAVRRTRRMPATR